MRIISEARLREFWQRDKTAERSMREWIKTVRNADWNNFSDLRQTFNHSDIHQNMIVFDVGGNKYRIIGKIEYRSRIVYIKAVLTHQQYNAHKNWCGCGQK